MLGDGSGANCRVHRPGSAINDRHNATQCATDRRLRILRGVVTTVTHLITGLDVGGAETMLARLVARSDRHSFRHRVISMRAPGDMATVIRAAGVPVESLDIRSGIPDPRAALKLRRLLSQDTPDILQSWMYHANLLASTARPAKRVPVIWNMRAVPDVDYGRQVAMIDATLSRLARVPAAIVVNSEYGRDYMAGRGYAGARWKVIPNGFDTVDFRPDADARRRVRSAWGVSEDQTLIGLVARIDPVKDHATFLEAARLLADHDSNTRFVCVGSGNAHLEAHLREVAMGKGIGDRVIWAGARKDIATVNCAFDIATCCSVSESFPNVVGEAMACGVPCVVTDVGDSAMLVGDTGTVVQPRSPSALASAWLAMIAGGKVVRANLGGRARERIQSDFSLDRVVADYEDLYTAVAHGK